MTMVVKDRFPSRESAWGWRMDLPFSGLEEEDAPFWDIPIFRGKAKASVSYLPLFLGEMWPISHFDP
ncbi:hypothetical protein A200_06402 [Parascardovia denticolens IPLA 20019]|nr:hypothetical protein A200_06402 [Parascardovia denticolens IPLA 20019]